MTRLFIFMLLLLSSAAVSAQRDSIGKLLDIGNNEDYEGFEILDSQLAVKRLFIAGETYSYAAINSKLEFKLLRYMNYKSGLRNFLVETSPARADLINQFINSDDSTVEVLLQSVSKVINMRLYKNLKRLNLRLPDSLKIRVYGVDVERSHSLPVVKMSQYLNREDIPDELRVSVEAVKGAAKYIITKGLQEYTRERDGIEGDYNDYFYSHSSFSVRKSMEEFAKNYDSLSEKYKSWLGDDFVGFDRAVGWLLEYKQFRNLSMTAMEYTWREELIFNRVNNLLEEMPEEKFFGQFGLCRAMFNKIPSGCGINQFSGLVYKLRNYRESLAKDVVAIGLLNSEELDKSSKSMNKLYPPHVNDLNYLFSKIPRDEVAIADLERFFGLKTISGEFDFVVLNNGYKLTGDVDDDPDTAHENTEKKWYSDSRFDKIYLGANRVVPVWNLNPVNRQLKSAGLDTINNIRFYGGELGMAIERTLVSFYGYKGFSDNPLYSSWMAGFCAGAGVIYKRFIKAGFMTSWTYIQNRITEKSVSGTGTYFSEFVAPKVYVNPALAVSVSADIYLDFSPFYIYLSGGYLGDISRKSWLLNGRTTGANGGLSASGYYTNVGLGVSLPIRWME